MAIGAVPSVAERRGLRELENLFREHSAAHLLTNDPLPRSIYQRPWEH
jgi:hypothetical protein